MSEENDAKEPEQSTGPDSTEVITGLKDQLQGLKAELDKTRQAYNGINPDEYHAMKDSLRQYQENEAKGGNEEAIEAFKQQLQQDFSKGIEERDSKINQLTSKVKELTVTNVAMDAASKVFTSSGQELVKLMVERELDLDGEELIIKDSEGKARLSPNDPRNKMSLQEWIDEKKEKYPDIVQAQVKSGTMTGGERASSNAQSNGGTNKDLDAARELLRNAEAVLSR